MKNGTYKSATPKPKICYLCNKEIDSDETPQMVQTRRRTKLYMHGECLRKQTGRKQ